uniref:C2H2-type domain-containing protein n=1 Tax=Meloidogyne hapla TaxID=6305 RepID=A0A1I8BBY5_MELHA
MEIQQEEHIQANIQQPNIQKEEQQNSPRQQKAQPVLTMRDAIIFAITYSTDLCSTIKMPYFLTLTPAELQELANGGENGNDVNGSGSSSRGRTRNITSETFMCLNKVRPTPNEHRDNCSAYSFWSPSEFSNGESQLVQLLLGASNSFSAPWQKRICPIGGHYSLAASRESVQLRTTHSSFWGQQQQQKIAQQQNITNNMFNPQRQHCDDVIIERGLIKNIPKNEDMEELYQLQHQQIIKMETDDKENGSNIIQQIPAFLPTKIDKEENTKITTTDNSIKLLQLPPNASKVGGFGGASSKFSLNRMKNINEEVQISTTQAMVQVYIRGRGRGRYVCERCGIRCKKPSMLKKHLRSHTNVRPFTCMTCNFSFKTKGNLTKHLVSKTHKRRMLDSNNEETMQGINTKSLLERSNGNDEENEGEGRLVVVEEEDEEENNVPTSSKEQQRLERKQEQAQRMRWEEEDWDDDDEEDEEEWGVLDDRTPQKDGGVPPPPPLSYRRFGQENILVERETHTPPTLWTRTDGQGTLAAGGYTDASGDEEPEPLDMGWPPQDEAVPERICQSAPPSALLSPGGRSRTKRKKKGKINNSQANVSDLKTSPTKFELLQQDSQQDLSPPVEHQHSLINQQQQPPPALANFIPSVSEQPLQQQPSLAAQLAAGLLQAAPFHNQQTIDLRQQQQFQAQQFLFQQINEQQQKQQQQHSSAFAPPISSNGNNNNRNFVSALKFLECQMNVGTSQIIGGENENNINNNGGDSFTTRGPQSTLEAFLATDVQQFQCDMCERKFRKESELLLHKQTHLIERRQKNNSSNSSLNNSFQCSECPTVVRSKSMLNRHVESVHGRSGNSEQLNNGLNLASQAQHIGPPPSSSQQMLPPQTNPTHNNHFRNFLCTDCNLGFRSHGVLAKHLRSKNHVKTLVSLGKLSEDANSLLIRDHSKALGNIDASNCEKALHSTKGVD